MSWKSSESLGAENIYHASLMKKVGYCARSNWLVVSFENLWMLGKVSYGLVVRLLKRGVRRSCASYDIHVVDRSPSTTNLDAIVTSPIAEVIILRSALQTHVQSQSVTASPKS